jgi:hypothetical protein
MPAVKLRCQNRRTRDLTHCMNDLVLVSRTAKERPVHHGSDTPSRELLGGQARPVGQKCHGYLLMRDKTSHLQDTSLTVHLRFETRELEPSLVRRKFRILATFFSRSFLGLRGLWIASVLQKRLSLINATEGKEPSQSRANSFCKIMQLREHPLMWYRGSPVWPPIWVGLESGKRPRGEIGSLNEVRCYPTKRGETYLIIEHEGAQYAGCLLLDDEAFCEQLGNFLQHHYGMLIKEIGSLDIPTSGDLTTIYRKASGW